MDGSGAEAPRPWYVTQRFEDADDFARAVQGSGVEYVPLQPSPYESRLTVLHLGGFTVQRAADQAHVSRGKVDPNVAGVLLPLGHASPPMVNGRFLDSKEGLLLGPGAELHALCPAEVEWASVHTEPGVSQDLADLAELRASLDRPGAILRLPPSVLLPLARTIRALTDDLTGMAYQAATPDMVRAVSASLLELLQAAFATAQESSVPRATWQALRLVGGAEAMLRADPSKVLFTGDLCAALGVSPRTLHKAFVAATGTSPQHFLRRWRLMRVHAALKAGGGDAGLVKSVALAHGFWHLGHFARSYREQFGQTPSETLAGARPGSYRRAVAAGA